MTEQTKQLANESIGGQTFFDKYGNLLVIFIVSCFTSLLVLCFYIFFIASNINKPVASVDVQGLMQEITVSTYKKLDTIPIDQQTSVVAESIKVNAKKLETAIDIVSRRHNVILIQKQAFSSTVFVDDYTKEVRDEMPSIK